jgi:hypothetical protein
MLAILETSTGRPVSPVPSELQIVGLAATSSTSAVVWSITTIQEIDLTSGRVLRAFHP